MVPAFPGTLELYGNITFSAGASMGAWESSRSVEDCFFFGVPAFPRVGEYKAYREIH